MGIGIFALLSLGALVYSGLFCAPFFYCCYSYLSKKKHALWFILTLSFIADLFWVVPLGQSGSIFLAFLLVLHAYKSKLNPRNQLFIFLLLGVFAYGGSVAIGVSLGLTHLFWFSGMFAFLALQLKKMRTEHVRVI